MGADETGPPGFGLRLLPELYAAGDRRARWGGAEPLH